jgi:hypothetical protein
MVWQEIPGGFDSDLLRQLDIVRDGTNSHAVGKSHAYYTKDRSEGHNAYLGHEIRLALATKNFKPLSEFMMAWW